MFQLQFAKSQLMVIRPGALSLSVSSLLYGGKVVQEKFGLVDNGEINQKQVQTKRDKICLCGESLYTLQPQFKFPPSID